MKIACFYQPGHNKNRTDRLNIWLVFYQRSVEEKNWNDDLEITNAVNINFFFSVFSEHEKLQPGG